MKKLLYLAAIALLWTSCKKEEILNPASNPSVSSTQLRTAGDVTFCNEASLICEQNGVLIFPDLTTLQKVVEDIELKHSEWQANGQSEQAEFKISIRFESLFNYTSLRNHIHNEREVWLENAELNISTDPDDKWVEGIGIRTVINTNGAIKIGNSIFVVKPFGETFEVTDGSFATMTAIVNGQTAGLNKTIIHKADGSQIDGSNGSVLRAASDCFSWKTKSDERTYKSGQRKAKGKVWVHNLPFYANIGSETENFKKKNNGNWQKNNASNIYTASGGTLYDRDCKNSGTISMSKTKSNKKDVQETVTYWNQKTQSKPNEYASFHSATDGSSSSGTFGISLN
ncbi:MAG: hypothetical protein Fur0041_18480 [Bacteroidia bacterium]